MLNYKELIKYVDFGLEIKNARMTLRRSKMQDYYAALTGNMLNWQGNKCRLVF